VVPDLPEQPERPDQSQGDLGLALERELERRSDVVVLAIEPVVPEELIPPLELRLGLLGESEEMQRVAAARVFFDAVFGEALESELPKGLEHPQPWLAVLVFALAQEALPDERRHSVEYRRLLTGLSADRLDGVEPAASGEHRKRREEAPLLVRQEVVAPLDRGPEGLLSLVRVARAAGQKRETLVQSSRQRLRGEQLEPRRRELDREREPVEPPADLEQGGGVLARRPEFGLDRSSPLDEEPDRVGFRERGHGILVLAREVQARAARDQDLRPFGHGQQACDVGRRVEEMLEVVEQQQQFSAAQKLGQRHRKGLAAVLPHAQCLGQGRKHERRVPDRCERNVEDTVLEVLDHFCCDVQGKPGLAGTSRAGDGDEPDAGTPHELT
jgi:hypothetical protein